MNSRHSRTALGLPGRLTIRACLRMPAAARESMARGVIWRDCHRMASAMPGAGRSTTDRVASGVRSVGEKPVPPVVRIRSARSSSHRRFSSEARGSTPSGSRAVCATV